MSELGKAVTHGVDGDVFSSLGTPEQFEGFVRRMRHTALTNVVAGPRSLSRTLMITDYLAMSLDPEPATGPGPHREGALVRTWWSEENMTKTAADLEAFLAERGYTKSLDRRPIQRKAR